MTHLEDLAAMVENLRSTATRYRTANLRNHDAQWYRGYAKACEELALDLEKQAAKFESSTENARITQAIREAHADAEARRDRIRSGETVQYGFRNDETDKITWWGATNYLAGLHEGYQPPGWTVVMRRVSEVEAVH